MQNLYMPRRSYRKTGPRDPTRCNAVLDFPRVAMMFLSAGEQHHEAMWRDWFRDAGGLIPRERLRVRQVVNWYHCSSTCSSID